MARAPGRRKNENPCRALSEIPIVRGRRAPVYQEAPGVKRGGEFVPERSLRRAAGEHLGGRLATCRRMGRCQVVAPGGKSYPGHGICAKLDDRSGASSLALSSTKSAGQSAFARGPPGAPSAWHGPCLHIRPTWQTSRKSPPGSEEVLHPTSGTAQGRAARVRLVIRCLSGKDTRACRSSPPASAGRSWSSG